MIQGPSEADGDGGGDGSGTWGGLQRTAGPRLERWFAEQGAPPRFDLARSGAAALRVDQVLALEGADAVAEYLRLSLDYGAGIGDERLRAAVAAAGHARRAAEVLITHGACEALLLTCGAVRRGGAAVVATPAYDSLLRAPMAAGARVVPVPIWPAEPSRLDIGPLLCSITAGVDAVLVNSPQNPTGRSLSADQVQALVERCHAVGAILVVDEVALGTLDQAAASVVTHPCFATGQVVAVGDASKAFGLGGLRVGWLSCARRELLTSAAGLKDLTSLANAVPTQVLAAIALEHHRLLTARARAAATVNLAALTPWLRAVGGSGEAPVDGLVTFPSVPGRLGVRAFAIRLRRDFDVSIVPGELFGHPRHLRLALGLPPADFREGLTRLAAALEAAPRR